MLKIKNLYKNYKDIEVLKGVDLQLGSREVKALIGVNGSGKSTLIEIVCGCKSANSGEVFVNNYNVFDKKQAKICKKDIGYMPQSFGLFNDLTVKENLEYMCAIYRLDKSRVDEVMQICKLVDCKDKLAQTLSGGYKQLLSYACAIIHKPKLVILDEPTSAMDPVFRKEFWKVVKSVKDGGASVLIITHFLEELMECDSFACLAQGKICYDGKVKDFYNKGFIDIEQILKKYSVGGK